MMNRFFTLLLAASCLTAVGQDTIIGSTYLSMESGFETVSVVGCTIGQTYQLVVSGTFGVHNSNCDLGDAAFYSYPDPVPNMRWVWNDICDACQSIRPDVDVPTEDHVYKYTFVAESETQSFHFQDPGPGDNCGGLTFVIYQIPVFGCTDQSACNFDAEANAEDGSCQYPICGCDCEGNCIAGGTFIYFYPFEPCDYSNIWPPTEMALGNEAYACLFSDPEAGHVGDSCLMYLNGNLVFEGIPGDYYASQGYGTLQTAPWPDNFPCSTDTLELKFPRPNNDTISLIGYWSPDDLWCDLSFIQGCTDPQAVNFSWEAMCDNGSCIIEGCTDSSSCNFDVEANSDDGSCDYSCCPGPGCCSQGLFWDWELGQCFPTNPADINLDGCVQLNDLLDLLSAYGDCAAEESPWQCGDPLEYQGYDYETVQIGEQCWFAENLRLLPEVSPPSVGSVDQAHAYVMNYSGSDEQFARTTIEYLEYGVLYNYEAIQAWELCPSGWRSPNISDLTALVSPFGGLDSAGEELKSTSIGGNNVTGFNAKAGGYRNEGAFGLEGVYGLFWMPQDEAYFDIYYGNDDVDIYYIANGGFDRSRAMSVRCLKNAE